MLLRVGVWVLYKYTYYIMNTNNCILSLTRSFLFSLRARVVFERTFW